MGQQVERLHQQLSSKFPCRFTHGNTDTFGDKQRLEVLKAFAAGDFKVLLSTPLMGRGVDIPNTNMVINFCLPTIWKERKPRDQQEPDVRQYLQRLGRASRMGRAGLSINLLASGRDKFLQQKFEEHWKV